MWSGLDRKGFFISRDETTDYVKLASLNKEPRSFTEPNPNLTMSHVGKDRGWIEGTNIVNFVPAPDNNLRNEYRDNAFRFFPLECLAIESYEHFLRLQWFCAANCIRLVNLTYGDIMRYPNSSFINPNKRDKLTKDTFPDVEHLYDLVDFSKWLFYKETSGMYEYVYLNNLGFIADNVHPIPSAHEHYVKEFVIPNLIERKLI